MLVAWYFRSVDICVVATLKDKVYLDGGHLYWVPGMADGSLGSPVDDGKLHGNFVHKPTVL